MENSITGKTKIPTMKFKYYCETTCGHNFYTNLKKKLGETGECDKCEGYPLVTIKAITQFR